MADSRNTIPLPKFPGLSRRTALAGFAALSGSSAVAFAATKPDTTSNPLTVEQWAATEFEAQDIIYAMPSLDQIRNPNLIAVQIAANILKFSKPELIKKHAVSVELEMFETMLSAKAFFEAFVAILETASLRLIIVDAFVELAEVQQADTGSAAS